MSNRERINVYVCPACHGAMVTKDVDEGVTPFMLRCRVTPGCKEFARSCFYNPGNFPAGLDLTPRWEWYKPSPEETRAMDAPMREHIDKGGLALRPAPGTEEPASDDVKIVARCVRCRGEFTEADIANRSACPTCGSTGVPMDPAQDVTIKINWHELRILTIWAENFAGQCDRKGEAGEHTEEPMLPVVYAIAKALQEQCPTFAPLTLSGEVEQIRQHFGADKVETNVPKGGPLPPKVN